MGKVKGAKAGRKLAKKRKKAAAKKAAAAAATASNDGGVVAAAAQYLEQWMLQQQQPSEPGVWKFNKMRQTFLLRAWPHRERMTSDTFKIMLSYAASLPTACAERTIAHAREVVASAEAAEKALVEEQQQQEQRDAARAAAGDEDDEDDEEEGESSAMSPAAREEKRAVLKIQLARALRLLKVLVEQPPSE